MSSAAETHDGPPPADERAGFIGSGLRAWELAAILSVAIVVFLFWGGALWSVRPGSSHVARIAVSYLLVPPLVVAALAVGKRWSWTRLATAIALLWSAKLVVTASLYAYLAPGSASQYQPAQTWQDASPMLAPETPAYRAAAALGALADVSGAIARAGAPLADAVVLIDTPPPGRALDEPRDVRLAIHGARYQQSIYLASVRDRVTVASADAALHTVRVARDGREVRDLPLPPGGAPIALDRLAAGVYELRCENHPGEGATLVIADHPYAARTDAAGRFALRGVPVGARRLTLLRHGHAPRTRALSVEAGAHELFIDVSEDE
jgi:hypothetical protein